VVWWRRRIKGGLEGILWHSMNCSLEFGFKALSWRCGVHVTLKREKIMELYCTCVISMENG
jgi:hypothetical protein